jgi:hypothetical protein
LDIGKASVTGAIPCLAAKASISAIPAGLPTGDPLTVFSPLMSGKTAVEKEGTAPTKCNLPRGREQAT